VPDSYRQGGIYTDQKHSLWVFHEHKLSFHNVIAVSTALTISGPKMQGEDAKSSFKNLLVEMKHSHYKT
jgi:hypothetical protein